MTTQCPHCKEDMGGYLITADVMTVDDVMAEFGGLVSRETVNRWFTGPNGRRSRQGWIHGFRVKGHRGWLVSVEQYAADFAALSTRRPVVRATSRIGLVTEVA